MTVKRTFAMVASFPIGERNAIKAALALYLDHLDTTLAIMRRDNDPRRYNLQFQRSNTLTALLKLNEVED